ncbi:hypothetical protein amrb99_72530 [Actinomadura sp. RB99]|uniref:hypothetical protein n=1 Tax=Actinomadura sp. RB99 TaxID=2691577 RepID=UPI001687AD01|nr:hypothetical protein [Actinomadura sp. RB99]MBD2898286.1 hypothetical protein [Actinomadura sp. RB99]
MTGPETTTTNYAEDNSQVGMQAGVVHGDVTIYSTPPGASPMERFEIGVRLLDGGQSSRAREVIREAVEAGLTGNRVCFHWQLALLSGRAWNEMPDADAAALRQAPSFCRLSGGDVWADGAKTVLRLIDAAARPNTDLRPLLKDFDNLAEPQRGMILRHLELFLEGPLKNEIWDRALTEARKEQLADSRRDRVWKYFHPNPVGPRFLPVRPPLVPAGTQARAICGAVVLGGAAFNLGYLLLRDLQLLTLLVYALGIGGGFWALHAGTEWHYLTERLRAKDREFRRPRELPSRAKPSGFAGKVDQRFDHYFARYVPRNASRQTWLDGTVGIRRRLRDEMVEVYREQRTSVEQIAWLIRYRVSEVRRQWENGTLWDYRRELAVPLSTKAATLLGLAALASGTIWAVADATRTAPTNAAVSALLALGATVVAARARMRIVAEARRHAADVAEQRRIEEGCRAAFERWKRKLADKPTDPEMAVWLDRDRKVLLSDALRHYGLTMSNVIAHAFIEAPGSSTKRARVRKGPWRYTHYRLLLFVLTKDGVRQVTADLDFERGTFHDRARTNYRYEAVAAVRVNQTDNGDHSFELALVNGELVKAKMLAAAIDELQVDETLATVSETTLDAAGLGHTLHVMEGIAAEGKRWLEQERRRRADRQDRATAWTAAPPQAPTRPPRT